MVAIDKIENSYLFKVLGWHRLWCLKSKLVIPEINIVSVTRYDDSFSAMQGIRLPGTYLPGVITAGSYYTKEGWFFCDITDHRKCLEISLRNERYSKLIIEVGDAEKCLMLFAAEKRKVQSIPTSEK